MKVILSYLFVVFISFNIYGQHSNVIIDNVKANYPNEPSIKLDPNNPDNIIAASNINNYYYSSDGGETWTIEKLSSPYGVWGDPALAVDSAGNFYFFHLSNPPGGNWIDRIVCQKTTDVGISWNAGSFMGLNGSKAQDKEWPVVDRRNNAIYVTWTQFDDYGSSSSQDSSHILFSRSFDNGDNWSEAKRINQFGGDCIDDDDTVEGAVPAVGPNGEIYVAWAGSEGIVFDRSIDQGDTWLDEDIFISENPGGWNYNIPGISRSNGLPVTSCDTSQSVFRGRIYVNWTDQRNGEEDTDVWLVSSSDGGNSWTDPLRVNNDAEGKQQFFSWMDLDQSNGNIYIVFYDRRNHEGNLTDVYLARSTDGGQSFSNHLISETPFLPNKGIFFGDYTNITAYNNVVRPIWTRLHEGELSVLTALVDTEALTTGADNIPYLHSMELEQNYPNPFSDETYISFKLRTKDHLDLTIYNNEGQKMVEVFKNKQFGEGKHVLKISEQLVDFSNGIYHYVLRSRQGSFQQKKMIQVD